jgi:protein tyrosine phosphatase (PTP) superfamily phosphohydrolase (DUF442 family)
VLGGHAISTPDVERILNFRKISDHVGTAGQPTREQFAGIRNAGYDVVINLAMPDSTNAIQDEADLVAAQGMDYVHIPVVWEDPTQRDLESFFDAMTRYQERKVFIHCALNWRVSAFVFLFRILEQGVPKEIACQDLNEVWKPNPTWERFMALTLEKHRL